jgi:hypothetical protein
LLLLSFLGEFLSSVRDARLIAHRLPKNERARSARRRLKIAGGPSTPLTVDVVIGAVLESPCVLSVLRFLDEELAFLEANLARVVRGDFRCHLAAQVDPFGSAPSLRVAQPALALGVAFTPFIALSPRSLFGFCSFRGANTLLSRIGEFLFSLFGPIRALYLDQESSRASEIRSGVAAADVSNRVGLTRVLTRLCFSDKAPATRFVPTSQSQLLGEAVGLANRGSGTPCANEDAQGGNELHGTFPRWQSAAL